MGKKSTNVPPPPDPRVTAEAQGDVNRETAITNAELNRINETNPFGSVTYTSTDPDGNGVPNWSRNVTLSPDEQAKLDASNALDLGLLNTGNTQLDRLNETFSTDLNFEGLPERVSSVNAGPIQTLDTDYRLRTGFGDAGPIQRAIDTNGLQEVAGLDDFGAERGRVEQALYDRGTRYMDDRFARDEDALRSRLANQGITEGSEAYNREVEDFRRNKNEAYENARTTSILGAGQEQGRLFDQSLAARGQGFGERATEAGFSNSAQMQDYSQKRDRADFFNNALLGQYGLDMGRAGFNNSAQQQRFTQDAQNAAMGNAARDAGFQERSYLRNLPLQDIAAMMGTANPANIPQFSPTPQVGMASPDLMGATYASHNANLQNAQLRGQRAGNIFGTIGSLGGALLASDRRLKADIKPLGKRKGIKWYSYRYLGQVARTVGVMADEVRKIKPSAVFRVEGFDVVDYSQLEAV